MVGVDLGTTYSVVAISQRNNVSVIPDAFGHVIIPSIVAFLPGGGLFILPRALPYSPPAILTRG